jgi:hypothetical protein
MSRKRTRGHVRFWDGTPRALCVLDASCGQISNGSTSADVSGGVGDAMCVTGSDERAATQRTYERKEEKTAFSKTPDFSRFYWSLPCARGLKDSPRVLPSSPPA